MRIVFFKEERFHVHLLESFEKRRFEERERREILRTAVCSRFLPSVEMTKKKSK